ncbi:ABC transporter ATP-binding protein [Swingsia samuiensis]|uniref:ATP-binding cassette domain-containing protein n=1 Tax=Swingsia samuiensis TaxID=1293412 RepID=A0A4Y6UJX1_9PROT|nr:oligopeptide/dipeptide ABC transporter ATP-binding protein [Swingsia samuiensis]QDH16691.1 ATP-binding cassette domain-containing protein [Swingsia samuiensis]
MTVLLKAQDVTKKYALGRKKVVHAVSDVSLTVSRGETLALVGESGCGKSTLGRMLVGLSAPSSGHIFFDDKEITGLSERAMRPWRPRMQMIFQDSYASFNPRRSVGGSLSEPLKIHRHKNIQERLEEITRLVGISYADLGRYPSAFSGGQRQRLNIARALVLKPELLVADEPVAALDVSIQAQIINLFRELQSSLGLASVFISHDLSVVRQMADRIAVMYLGRIIEEGESLSLIATPLHPYTRALLAAVPQLNRPLGAPLKGDIPSPVHPPSGCAFHTRCPVAQPRCALERPLLQDYGLEGRRVACHYPQSEVRKL